MSTGPLSLRRGDYLTMSGTELGANGVHRVLRVNAETCVVTARRASRWRAVEWMRARCEDWMSWPLDDLKACLRVRTI